MLNNILSDKWLGLLALATSILSFYVSLHNWRLEQSTKFAVSIVLRDTLSHSGRTYSYRCYGFIQIVNLSKTAKTIESIIFELPNSTPEYPELEYIAVTNSPRTLESEEIYEIQLTFSDIEIAENLANSQRAYAAVTDIKGNKWRSKKGISIGTLRHLKKIYRS